VRDGRDKRPIDQLALFPPRPTTPPWESFPAEVREQTLGLIAQLLRTHRRVRLSGPDAAQEVGDE